MCTALDFNNVPFSWYLIAGFVLMMALGACVSAFHPDQLRPKTFFGIKVWSNHVLFDPRKCGYCSILAWLPVFVGLLVFLFKAYC